MSDYRLFGAETSPYSLKVRSFLRYKNIAFDWISRDKANEAEFQALAQVASVPLLISPNRPASQDSTAIIAGLESDHAEPSAVPDDAACAALALVLEDYADEWLNKCMFQQRWGQVPDRDEAALRVLAQLHGGKRPRAYKKMQKQIAERMAARLPLVGAEAENAVTLDTSYKRFALRLNAHLQEHLYIFGGRPSVADFALAGQFRQLLMDATPAAWLGEHTPFLIAWCDNMDDPKPGAPFATLETLSPTLAPIFAGEVSQTYLPWSKANAASASRQRKKFSVTLSDGLFEQSTQSYAARSFKAVRKAVSENLADEGLTSFLKDTDCLTYFN